MEGMIVKVWPERGYGFIRDRDKKEYFFHKDVCIGFKDFSEFTVGKRVEFEPATSERGARAASVSPKMVS